MKRFRASYRVFILTALVSICCLFPARRGSAHAILIEAVPAANSKVAGPDIAIKLRFSSRIDPARSRLTLLLPDGGQRKLEIQKQESPDTLSSQAKGLSAGAYRLQWQVLATDGHITRGEVPFEVISA